MLAVREPLKKPAANPPHLFRPLAASTLTKRQKIFLAAAIAR